MGGLLRFGGTDDRSTLADRVPTCEEERVHRLREFGVRAFTSMIYPHKHAMAEWLNQWAVEFAAQTPDCLHTATFYPEESAASYVGKALESGARIFKSHIQVGNYDPNDPLLDKVWGQLEDSETPIVIHCGSGRRRGEYTGPDRIASLLARYPRLSLIVAHMGDARVQRIPRSGRGLRQCPPGYDHGVHRLHGRAVCLPEGRRITLVDMQDRILFGSDFPNIPYPYLTALQAVTRFDLGDEWLRAVVHDNAAKLFSVC